MNSDNTQRRPAGVMGNTAILAGYTLFEIATVFLFTIVLARYLGAGDFGRLGFALSYALLFSVLQDPGISMAMTKLVAITQGERQSGLVATGFTLRLLLSALLLLISLVPFGFSAYMRQNAGLIILIVLSENFRSLVLYFGCVFRGHQRNKYEALSLAVERVASLAAGSTLLILGYGINAIAWVYFSTRLASLLIAVFIYLRRFGWLKPNLNPELVRNIRKEATPLAVLLVCERTNMYLPPILVTVFAGEHATGIFQAAFKAVMPAVLMSTAVAASLYAPMASRFTTDPAESARLFRAGVRVLLHLLLPAAVVTLLLSRQLTVLLYGVDYAAAAPVLQALTPYYVSIVFIAISHLFMPAIDRQKAVAVVSVVSVVVNVVLGLVLVPRWGPTGGGIGLAAAQVVMATVYLALARKYGNASLGFSEWRTITLAFASALLAVGAVRAVLSANPLINVLEGASLSVATYVLILALLGGISTQERYAVRLITRKFLLRPV
jgi:O-antigen/teichoic acid export membrane protein